MMMNWGTKGLSSVYSLRRTHSEKMKSQITNSWGP